MSLDEIQSAVELHLEKIEKVLGPNYTLTLIATHNGSGGLMDADLILTMSDRKSILRAVDRFLPAGEEGCVNDKREETYSDDFDDDDDFDEESEDCGMFPSEGTWVCMEIGSEPCEFCPNRTMLGTSVANDRKEGE